MDMSADERATMIEHFSYWSVLTEQGRVLAFGPVGDPGGAYGIGIVLAESRPRQKRCAMMTPPLGRHMDSLLKSLQCFAS